MEVKKKSQVVKTLAKQAKVHQFNLWYPSILCKIPGIVVYSCNYRSEEADVHGVN